MKCPSCGKENPAGEQYCLDCGSDLSAAPPAGGAAFTPAPAGAAYAPTPAAGGGGAAGGQSLAMSDEEFQRLLNTPAATSTCPHCGAPASAGGTFCDNCGEPLSAAPAAAGGAAAADATLPNVPVVSAPPAAVAPEAPPTQPIAAPVVGTPPAAPVGSGVLLEFTGPSNSGQVAMSGDELKIGRRDADASIYPDLDFDGNDIVVEGNDRVHAVSRRHARVFREGGELKFEDLGSTNGSTLNGAPVLAHDPQPLKDGDRIVLGRTCRITVHAS